MKKAILPAIVGLGIAVTTLFSPSAVASADAGTAAVRPAAFGVEQPTWMGPIRCELPWNWDRPECWWLHHRRYEEPWRPGFGAPCDRPRFGEQPGFGGPGFRDHPGFGEHGGFGWHGGHGR